MDADLLRLILLGLGVLLVLGIYLWDRVTRRRARPRPHARPQPAVRRAPGFDPDAALDDPLPSMPAEARLPDPDDGVPADHGSEFDPEPEPEIAPAAAQEAVGEPEPLQLTEWDQIDLNAEPELKPDMTFDAHGGSDYLHVAPELQDDVPRKILQINLVPRDGEISGEALLKALKEVDLKAGAMDIFHRYDSQLRDQVLFSMASMVEPGSFPLRAMKQYSTAGVTLFTQLPGVRDGLAIYSDMLFTAERLAALLNAELRDETHSVLSKQWIEHTREAILEHRRQVQLARSRA